MTNEQIKQFYHDLAAICTKYDMQGLVGVWFHKSTDLYGFMKFYDIADTTMKTVVEGLAARLQEFCDHQHAGPTVGNVHDVSGSDKQKN